MNGGTNGQSASGAAAWSCLVRSFRREVVGHQRCAGWLQGLSFLVVCREGRGIGAVVDALWGECGIGVVVDAVE